MCFVEAVKHSSGRVRNEVRLSTGNDSKMTKDFH
jgi:hypothetical protein